MDARTSRVLTAGSRAVAVAAALLPLSLGTAGAQADARVSVFLYANEVRDVAVVGSDVYAATSGGLLRYAQGAFTQMNREPQGLLSDSLVTLAASPEGQLWCGTARAGVSILDPLNDRFVDFTSLLQPIPGNHVRRLRFSGTEEAPRLLVGTEKGYAVFENGDLRFVCFEGVDICGLPSFDVLDLIEVGPDLWLATAGGVVVQQAGGGWTPRNEGLSAGEVSALASGDSLFAAGPTGVFVRRESAWGSIAAGLPADFVPQDLEVHGGTVWVAGKGGVFRRVGRSWERLGTASMPATSLAFAENGVIYAGASDPDERQDGLWRWDGASWTQERMPGPRLKAAYKSVLVDGAGTVWASVADRGVVPFILKFRNGTWTSYPALIDGRLNAWTQRTLEVGSDLWLAHCCCDDEERCTTERIDRETGRFRRVTQVKNAWQYDLDQDGNLWVATYSEDVEHAHGLMRMDGRDSTWTEITVATAPGGTMRSNQIRAIRVVGNQVWIGYDSDGVHRLDLGSDGLPLTADDLWTPYTTSTSRAIVSDQVRRIELAPDGKIWVGTAGGISIFDGTRFTNLTPGNGSFPTAEVNAIIPIQDGEAWVATREGGVTHLIPSDRRYRAEVFLPPLIPNPNVVAMSLDRDARSLWLATSRGLARFTPPRSVATGSTGKPAVYPNPFIPGCVDGVRLIGLSGEASGVLVDVTGDVLTRVERASAGDLVWDGMVAGAPAAPGLYWFRITTNRGVHSVPVGVIDAACP